QSRPKVTAPAIKYEDKRPRHVAASQWSAVGAPHWAEQVRVADLLHPLALAHRSGRSALFQSGMAKAFSRAAAPRGPSRDPAPGRPSADPARGRTGSPDRPRPWPALWQTSPATWRSLST